ncbi:MAG TPA: OsmC family protein [Phycisphaerae bacterium]|nr:OsmC family protein [Phycisphaerae bacterium]
MGRFIMRQVSETALEMQGGDAATPWTVRLDVPEEGGVASGPTPTQLFAFALAGCKAIAALRYAARKHAKLRGVIAEVSYEYADNPRRVSTINIRFQGIKEQMDNETLKRVTAAMEACTIANTLKHPPVVQIFVE